MGTARDATAEVAGHLDFGALSAPNDAPQGQTVEQAEIARFTRQLDAGHPRLRFAGSLESMFQRDYEVSAGGSRSVLLVMATAMIAITPVYDTALLAVPDGFARLSHLIQWCLMLPPLLLSLVAQRWKPLSHDALKQSLGIGAAFAVWAGLTAQRGIAGYYDFYFPHNYGVIPIAATFIMGRLGFFRLLPWALLMLGGSLGVELLRYSQPAETLGAGINNSMSITMMWLIAAAGAWLFEHVSRGAWLRQEIYRRLAIYDTLTGLSNRHHFQEMMELLIRRAERERQPITVMLLDIDHFKAFNDHYGHVAGDDCLRHIGSWLSTSWRRDQDLRARLGGEEFVAVWIGMEASRITEYAEGLREGIARQEIAHAASPTASVVTASAGLIHGIPTAGTTADILIRSADALLYSAKEAGRNRLVASIGSLETPVRASTVVPFSAPISNPNPMS
jgi:diguanylate cyclase (GGDEF)-like protein